MIRKAENRFITRWKQYKLDEGNNEVDDWLWINMKFIMNGGGNCSGNGSGSLPGQLQEAVWSGLVTLTPWGRLYYLDSAGRLYYLDSVGRLCYLDSVGRLCYLSRVERLHYLDSVGRLCSGISRARMPILVSCSANVTRSGSSSSSTSYVSPPPPPPAVRWYSTRGRVIAMVTTRNTKIYKYVAYLCVLTKLGIPSGVCDQLTVWVTACELLTDCVTD